jgi:hypothetical protein
MPELIDFESEPKTSTTLREQRRPGRPEFVDPNLIPLMRGDAPLVGDTNTLSETVEAGDFAAEPDRKTTLNAARGICLGVGLGSLIWCGIGFAFWYYFHG